jgi:thiol-disulfide isomerase/thioredoxin
MFADFDFYRKIPKDLTESATHGVILSVCAAAFMAILFICELWAFLTPSFSTNVIIDSNSDNHLMINFNITVLDMPCEYATIDVIDVLGTRTQNISKNIHKWQVDESGIRRNYEGRNVQQSAVAHDTHHDLERLLSNGQHAVPMDEPSFDGWLKNHPNTFVDFYAPWCVWCQRLEPTWEAFAEKVEADSLQVSVVKVVSTALSCNNC